MPSPVSGRLLRRALIAGAVALVLAGGAAAFVLLHSPGNVSHPNLEFTDSTATQPPAPPRKRRVVVNNFLWPWYGHDNGRTRAFTGNGKLHPPLHVTWLFSNGGLLEFPPVIYQTTLHMLDDNGSLKAVNTVTGRLRWQRKVGTLAAASPVAAPRDKLVLVPLLSTNRPVGNRVSPATTRVARTPSTRALAIRCGRSGPTEPVSVSARASSTRAPPSPSAVSTWGTPTGACTRSVPATARSRGPPARVRSSTPRPRSPKSRDSARRSTSAPTTATCMPSTPSRAPSAGATRQAGRSLDRRRSSETSSTTRISARRPARD